MRIEHAIVIGWLLGLVTLPSARTVWWLLERSFFPTDEILIHRERRQMWTKEQIL